MQSQLTLGEYIRRLRRDRRWSLQQLADETGISYTHLSRIENDSTLPNSDSVAKLAEALDGHLPMMLEMANCLPRSILDRITENADDRQSLRLLRRANVEANGTAFPERLASLVLLLLEQFSVSQEEAQELATGVDLLAHLPSKRRTAFLSFLQAERGDAGGQLR